MSKNPRWTTGCAADKILDNLIEKGQVTVKMSPSEAASKHQIFKKYSTAVFGKNFSAKKKRFAKEGKLLSSEGDKDEDCTSTSGKRVAVFDSDDDAEAEIEEEEGK